MALETNTWRSGRATHAIARAAAVVAVSLSLGWVAISTWNGKEPRALRRDELLKVLRNPHEPSGNVRSAVAELSYYIESDLQLLRSLRKRSPDLERFVETVLTEMTKETQKR